MEKSNDRKYDEYRRRFREVTGDFIRRKRKRMNLTQENIGNAIGVTKAAISCYESGKMEMPASSLFVLSRECGFSMAEYIKAWSELELDELLSENAGTEIAGLKIPDDTRTENTITEFAGVEIAGNGIVINKKDTGFAGDSYNNDMLLPEEHANRQHRIVITYYTHLLNSLLGNNDDESLKLTREYVEKMLEN